MPPALLLSDVHRWAAVCMRKCERLDWGDKGNCKNFLKLALSSACSFWYSRPWILKMQSIAWCLCGVCFITASSWEPVHGPLLGVEVWRRGAGLLAWTCCSLPVGDGHSLQLRCLPCCQRVQTTRSALASEADLARAKGLKWVRKRCCGNAGHLANTGSFPGGVYLHVTCMVCAHRRGSCGKRSQVVGAFSGSTKLNSAR